MKRKEKNSSKKSNKHTVSTILYIAAAVVFLITIGSLVDNIILYKNSVAQYVSQGYPVALVTKQLIPSQLLPGLFDTIAVYGGIALILFGAGIINKRVSECLMLLTKNKAGDAAIANNALASSDINVNEAQTNGPTEGIN